MAIPIWKDKIVTLGTGDSIFYRITIASTGTVIYSGKAFKKPGESYIKVKINDICADYLGNVLPFLPQGQFNQLTPPVTFNVQYSYYGSSWTTQEAVQFLNDWSYDYSYNASTMGMSFSVSGRIDSRMPIVWTSLSASSVTATIYYKNGSSTTTTLSITSSSNNDFDRSVRSAGRGTVVYYPGSSVDRVIIGNATFRVVTDCAKYALYYLNAYGGWDCLLIEGGDMESDTLNRYTTEVVYDNNYIQNRGIRNYVNEITKGFTLHTGWLSDAESQRMHHLANSTDVYLYDIAKSQMIPVTIPTNILDYKTYKNQGNRMVDYAIQVQVAQSRIRR